MTTPNDPTIPQDSLDGIIAAYLEAIDAGHSPDREALLKRYPQHAEQLRSFFLDHDRIDLAAAPLRLAETSDSSQDSAKDGSGALPRIRYFGDYELLEEIARGGMGIVYKARQASLNRIVAVKMILAGQFASEIEVQRFYAEARAAANLQHPNIVAIHEVGQHENQHYFSMDYIEGKSLAQIVRESPLPAEQAAGYLKTIAEAIEFAHHHGTLHRDLKPSNVLIDRFDQPQITDFGLAKRIMGTAQITATGPIMGTPSYMPPEQAGAHDGKVSPASDVYSLGALLYDLLTGRPPFLGENLVVTLNQLLNNEPVSPRLLSPKVSRDLETICLKCLQKDPHKRYPAAAALADDLGRFLRHEPITARPVSQWGRGWRWCKRNPTVSSLSAAIAVLLLVSAIGGSVLAIGERNAREVADRNAELESQAARRAELASAEADRRRLEADSQRNRAESATRESEHRLYASQIAAANLEWNAGTPIPAWRHLDASRADLRGWEYRYLHSLFNRNQRTLVGHNGAVNQAIFSPNGKQIASASDDGSVKLWDAATGRNLLTLDGSHGAIKSIAFSPDGRRIVSGSESGTINVWNASTGHNELALNAEEAKTQLAKVAFSADGKRIFGTAENGIRAWDSVTGHVTPLTHSISRYPQPLSHLLGLVRGAIDFGRAGPSRGARVSAKFEAEGLVTLKCFDSEMWTFPAENACPIPGPVTIDSSHRWLATTNSDGSLIICNAATGQDVRIFEALEQSQCLSFSPDSRRVAIGNTAASLKLVEWETGKVLQVLNGHKAGVLSVVFSPDGKQLLSASSDKTIKVWSLTAESTTIQVPKLWGSAVFDVKPGSDGETIAATQHNWADTDGKGVIFSAKPHGQIHVVDTGPVIASDGNSMIGASDSAFSLWETFSGTRLLQWENNHTALFAGVSTNVEKGLAAWLQYEPEKPFSAISVWDLKGRKQIAQIVGGEPREVAAQNALRHEQPLFGLLTFSKDGTKLAAADLVGRLHLWSLPSLIDEVIFDSHGSVIGPVAFRPDGRQIAVADGVHGTVTLVNTNDHRRLLNLENHFIYITDIAFSPDGTRLASSGGDNTVRLWNTETGEEMLVLPRRATQIQSLAFGPGGKYVIAANAREIVVWDASDESSDVYAAIQRLRDQISDWNCVDALLADLLLKSDVIERLKSDATLSKESRDGAIQIATRRNEDPVQLNNRSWAIASRPNSTVAEYEYALRLAEAACRAAPGEVAYANTLGVARFRLGKFKEAIASLTLSYEKHVRSPDDPEPGDVAFLAMSHHALGHARESQQFMGELTRLLEEDRWKKNAEATAFLKEAQERLSKKP
jgi:WD40 repeat protein/tRNA A-37 threonylcarbamoyl transferase component Bud32